VILLIITAVAGLKTRVFGKNFFLIFLFFGLVGLSPGTKIKTQENVLENRAVFMWRCAYPHDESEKFIITKREYAGLTKYI